MICPWPANYFISKLGKRTLVVISCDKIRKAGETTLVGFTKRRVVCLVMHGW